jgi:drug/metabolite transporter (DMT)-like permease
VSFAYHEPITLSRIAGTLLITSGVFWLGWRMNRSGAAS